MKFNIFEFNMKFIMIFLILILLMVSNSMGTTESDDYLYIQLTKDIEGVHESPSIAVVDNNLYIVWNAIQNEYTTSSIYFVKSVDHGKTWSNNSVISGNSTTAYNPTIAINENIIHVAWQDFINDNPEIYYIKSSDNGENWDLPKRLTYNSSRKQNIYDILIKADVNYVYLTWKDYRTGSSEIFFKKSTDKGMSWLLDQRLTIDHTPSYYPSLAANGKNLFIAYQDGGTSPNICLIKSENYGDNWTEKQYITDHSGDISSEKPEIVFYNQQIFLIWQDDRTGNEEIYFKSSSDEGRSWGDSVQLTNNLYSDINPKIYVDQDRIIIIWIEGKNNTLGVSKISSIDKGNTWNEIERLSTKNDCYDPKIVGENNTIHIIWQEYDSDNSEIWYVRDNIDKQNDGGNVSFDESVGFEILFFIIGINILIIINYMRRKKG